MFFIIIGTYTRWTFIIFSLVQRILLLIFPCHTVTHGTDLRRSPQLQDSVSRSRNHVCSSQDDQRKHFTTDTTAHSSPTLNLVCSNQAHLCYICWEKGLHCRLSCSKTKFVSHVPFFLTRSHHVPILFHNSSMKMPLMVISTYLWEKAQNNI